MTPVDTSPILCFGEILWDCLPRGLFLGGAPVNVAYHLNQSGENVFPVSSIGNDFLGAEILRRMDIHHLPATFISRSHLPTGVVIAEISSSGDAKYEIRENVAWDQIDLSSQLLKFIEDSPPKALIYGSLAQRSSHNMENLLKLLNKSQAPWNIFDVNLRPPYDCQDRVNKLIEHAHLVKMNDEELFHLTHTSPSTTIESAARKLSKKMGEEKYLCITAGAKGAGILSQSKWYWEDAQPVQVKDTVGAGDSFLATLVTRLTQRKPIPETLTAACRMGEFIASQEGAMPTYQLQDNGDLPQ